MNEGTISLEHDEYREFLDLRAPEIHWFFVEATKAARAELWLAAAVMLVTGIENSIRVTLRQLEAGPLTSHTELGSTLSNALLRKAHDAGMHVACLAFAGEEEFAKKIQQREPLVELVMVRHDLCHGNILGFVDRRLGPGLAFFTPECLSPLVEALLPLAREWCRELVSFRKSRGLG
jgi:hypothetical protein